MEYKRRKRNRLIRRIVLWGALFAALFIFRWGLGEWWWMWFLFGGGAAADLTSDSRRDLTGNLVKTRDPRAVPALAMAARDGDSDTQRVAARGLIEILPGVKASDASFIDSDAVDALASLLKLGDLPLSLAVLRSFRQVGNRRALNAVRELTDSEEALRALGPNWWESRHLLRDAAQETLPYLEQRVEEEAARQSLLRASSSPDSADSLLRPVKGGNTEEQALLRPAE